MEAFEHIAKVYLESFGYVVTGGVKFPIRRSTKKPGESQTHGYEVDLVGARSGSLVLASVKSFFGSAGVNRQGFKGLADDNRRTHYHRYTMFNEPDVRQGLIDGAVQRYGFRPEEVSMQLFVGKFRVGDREAIQAHLSSIPCVGEQIKVVGLHEMVERLKVLADANTYTNDPVVVTLKALRLYERTKAQSRT